MGRWVSSNYYKASMDQLLAHLAFQEAELVELLDRPIEPRGTRGHAMSERGYKVNRKRAVIAKVRQAVVDRMAWHAAEIRKAEAAGFTAASEHEPRTRTIKVGSGAHA
jgi:hypothetical protein